MKEAFSTDVTVDRRQPPGEFLSSDLDNMTKWISDPQSVAPGNAMPNMGIKPTLASDHQSRVQTSR
jgi:hypothetical protein